MSKVTKRLDLVEDKVKVLIDRQYDFEHTQSRELSQRRMLKTLDQTINDEVVISFGYSSLKGERSQRTLSPYEIKWAGTGPHLVGYDHVRQHVRQFNVQRINSVWAQPAFEFAPPRGKS